MYTITFYSFKGGVGRTMALVNVAAELVRRGRKVLVVDFDLEAPGLETYKHLHPEKPHPGIVEYVTEFRDRNFEVPNLLDYVYETKQIGKKGGRLWVMPAGRRDRSYRSALANLDWQRLYKEESGFLLFEDTKLGWEQEYKPDYVLIDSRTGDTDVLGICTRQLPDSVVLMFTPNEQNLAGLENICRDIRREETEGLKKKIKLHFVAANVPDLDDERGILHRQMQAFKERLGFSELSGIIRRYENFDLLNQSVFVLDRPHSKLARSYRRLFRRLARDNVADRDGAMLFLKAYPEWMERRTSGAGVRLINYNEDGTVAVHASGRDVSADGKQALLDIARHFTDDVQVLQKVASCFVKEEEHTRALNVLDRVLHLDPNLPDALYKRALCKTNTGDVPGAANDFLACLRVLKPKLGFFQNFGLVAACVERIGLISPSKLADVADLFETQGIEGIDIENFAGILCQIEEGVPHGARVLRNYLARVDRAEIGHQISVLASALLRARCWKEVIELLEGGAFEGRHESPTALLDLALAHWGQDGRLPEAICREVLQCDFGGFSCVDIQPHEVAGWMLWGSGNVPEALAELEKAEKRAMRETDAICSLWRLREVSVAQYMDDCRLVRRMFQGEPLRPTFLGPEMS